jgi:hypothetical protein
MNLRKFLPIVTSFAQIKFYSYRKPSDLAIVFITYRFVLISNIEHGQNRISIERFLGSIANTFDFQHVWTPQIALGVFFSQTNKMFKKQTT